MPLEFFKSKYKGSEIDDLLDQVPHKADLDPVTHRVPPVQIPPLSELDNDAEFITLEDIPPIPSTDWNDIPNKPSTFPPDPHNHNDIYNTKAEITAFLDGKVDKVAGKGLSTNDFTDLLRDKVLSAPTQEDLNTVIEIAEGKPTARVFDDPDEAFDFLESNPTLVRIGDIFYIRQTAYPDYWYDGITLQPFEVEKPNLTDYVKKNTTINGKPLSSNISLNASDIGARTDTWVPSYGDITGDKPPTDAQKNVQPDWNEVDTGNDTFIKNKPTIPSLPIDVVFIVESLDELTEGEKEEFADLLSQVHLGQIVADDFILMHNDMMAQYHYESYVCYPEGYCTFVFNTLTEKVILTIYTGNFELSSISKESIAQLNQDVDAMKHDTTTPPSTKAVYDFVNEALSNLLGGEY